MLTIYFPWIFKQYFHWSTQLFKSQQQQFHVTIQHKGVRSDNSTISRMTVENLGK